MILLDTSVLSEALKPVPDPSVLEWLDRQNLETLFLSTISIAELRFGVAALSRGRRRDGLSAAVENRVASLFRDRIVSFDITSANAYATILSEVRRAGKAIGATDGFIAAIAAAHGLAVATRDTAPFEAAGLEVINPWVRK